MSHSHHHGKRKRTSDKKRSPRKGLGRSKVNPSGNLQQVIEEPTLKSLTPSVVSELHSTMGNQFVGRLVQRAKDNVDSGNSNSSGNLVIQRKYPPESKKSERTRNKGFNARQAGVALADAFEGAIDTINKNVSKAGGTFKTWRDAEVENAGKMSLMKKGRLNGYDDAMSVIAGGNVDDWVSLRMYSENNYTAENFAFLKAAHDYKSSANASRFHQVMDAYIYDDSDLMINIDSMGRNGLIERAWRMIDGTVDDAGNPTGQEDFEMSDNPLFG